MATLIKTNGVTMEVKPWNGKRFTLEELQDFVEGRIDIQTTPSGKNICLNDEGKLENLPKNELATALWIEEYPIEKYPHNNDQLIVGNVLVWEAGEMEKERSR